MIKRTSHSEIVDYFNSKNVGQSTLKLLLSGVYKYNNIKDDTKELYYEEKEHFIIGSGVDTWLTEGSDEFEKQFHWLKSDKPSDKLLSIAHRIVDTIDPNFRGNSLKIPDDIFLKCIEDENYYSTYKKETKLIKVRTAIKDYLDEIILIKNKQICDNEQWTKIHKIVHSFQENEPTLDMFNEEFDKNDIIRLFQVPIYFTYNGIKCKALIDNIIINTKTKSIVLVDIKTTGDQLINFGKSINKFRYDIQGAFYTTAAKSKEGLKIISNIAGIDVTDYKITEFAFAVETVLNPVKPIIVRLSRNSLFEGLYGKNAVEIKTIKFHKKKGIIDLLEEYSWYLENGFSREKLFVEAGNVVTYSDGKLVLL